jgi:peroxiredoxin
MTLPSVGNKVGMRAPDFTLAALDGTTDTMSDHLGKIIMVNFWLTHCGACQAETPYIQAIYDTWPNEKLALLAITPREDPQTVKEFMNKNRLTFPVLLDLEGQVDAQYQPEGFPTTYFIDTRGIIRRIELGRFSSLGEIEEILESIQ